MEPIAVFPLVHFAVALLVTHWWALSQHRARRTWIKLEYFPLFVASFAIFALSIELDKVVATNMLKSERYREESLRRDIARESRVYASWFLPGGPFAWRHNDRKAKVRELVETSNAIWRAAEKDPPDVDQLRQLHGTMTTLLKSGDQGDQIFASLADQLKFYLVAHGEMLAMEARSGGWPTTGWLLGATFFLAPWALAIPIAKITAELRDRIAD